MQESQIVQMSRTGPLPQQSIDFRKAGPLPAGGAGQHQRQRSALRLAERLLLPQQTAVFHRQPGHTKETKTKTHFLLDSPGEHLELSKSHTPTLFVSYAKHAAQMLN